MLLLLILSFVFADLTTARELLRVFLDVVSVCLEGGIYGPESQNTIANRNL
jgi:hypothetical protein